MTENQSNVIAFPVIHRAVAHELNKFMQDLHESLVYEIRMSHLIQSMDDLSVYHSQKEMRKICLEMVKEIYQD